MQNSILEYMSSNGIRFHHILSTYSLGEEEELAPETHYLYEMFILLSGKATYSINGQLFPLNINDILIVPPNAIHSIKFDTENSCERMVMSFSPNLLPTFDNIDFLSTLKTTISIPYFVPAKYVKKFMLLAIFENANDICRKQDKQTDLYLLSLILQFIAKLNELLQQFPETTNWNETTSKTTNLSYHCIQYVNSHLTENISIDDLAQALKYSVSHIRQTFKKESGLTLHEYIFIQKMQLAKQMLQKGEKPAIVASNLGYEYYSTFYHHYVKRFRVQPTALSDVADQHFFGEEISASSKPVAQKRNKTKNTSKEM